MGSRSTTPEQIVDAARRLFNAKGYAATTLTEIASAVGISQGNLTYHFPTKQHLARRIREDARAEVAARLRNHQPGPVADDYVEHLLFAMANAWNYRFILRDRRQYLEPEEAPTPSSGAVADYGELGGLVERIASRGLLRADVVIDPPVLTRSLWVLSRYWMDYLAEMEGIEEVTWLEQERGIRHHFAVLLPCLTAAARREFEAALERATVHRREAPWAVIR